MKQGQIIEDREARDSLVITRAGTERVVDFAFKLARERKALGGRGLVTCVDKANVFRSFAFFRKVFDEVAARYPDIEADHAYVDATALNFVRRPWSFDVLVTENIFGDILSDLAAGRRRPISAIARRSFSLAMARHPISPVKARPTRSRCFCPVP